MATVMGCNVPEDLFYNVGDNVWAREEGDGTITVGMTAVATTLAGAIVAFTPKKAGKGVEAGKSIATVESGKWVGPVKNPVGGEVIAINEDAKGNPGIINEDPYGAGWLVKVQPADWAAAKGALLTGGDVASAYETKLAADGFGGCK
ncbi:MAG: glycine cleavage system protein H [Alphaproteobacteria bacterium CG_4_10_14_0_2_um_filter_63_37]|nr:MAG: glycine cleavage system protein H [Proteobacteria bacterium CG1_02_64_396]PJA24078.1 MAG: glycine cleavage system protein H [Alphaproteobacteria bacterium CG_4_10_14_0_2_um_filter_63_37]